MLFPLNGKVLTEHGSYTTSAFDVARYAFEHLPNTGIRILFGRTLSDNNAFTIIWREGNTGRIEVYKTGNGESLKYYTMNGSDWSQITS